MRTVRKVSDRAGFAGVQTERLIVDVADAHQMRAVAFVEPVHVGDVLEVIGVEGAVLYRSVRRDVVIEHCDFQIDILLGQDRLHNLKDFSVGCRCGADLNGDGFCVVVVAAGAGGLVGIAAAGRQQAQGQSRCQSNCGELLQFHNKISFVFEIYDPAEGRIEYGGERQS